MKYRLYIDEIDIIAYPSFKMTRDRYKNPNTASSLALSGKEFFMPLNKSQSPQTFGEKIINVLIERNKHCSNITGKVDGWGIKFFPFP
ncbi:MAG: hypothetical protein Kow0090_19350 [Myxococcota bacterium]